MQVIYTPSVLNYKVVLAFLIIYIAFAMHQDSLCIMSRYIAKRYVSTKTKMTYNLMKWRQYVYIWRGGYGTYGL
jgi:hypothetical protein